MENLKLFVRTLMMSLMMAFVVSCAENGDGLNGKPQEGDVVQLTINADCADLMKQQTKVDFEASSDGLTTFAATFEAGDAISILDSTGKCIGNLTTTEGGAAATFDGEVTLSASTDYTAIYPAIDVDATQSANATQFEIAQDATDAMKAIQEAATFATPTFQIFNGEDVNLTFNHAQTYFEFTTKNPKSYDAATHGAPKSVELYVGEDLKASVDVSALSVDWASNALVAYVIAEPIVDQALTWTIKTSKDYAVSCTAKAVANNPAGTVTTIDLSENSEALQFEAVVDDTVPTINNETAGGLAALLAAQSGLTASLGVNEDSSPYTAGTFTGTTYEKTLKITGVMNTADFTALSAYMLKDIDLSEVTISGTLAAASTAITAGVEPTLYWNAINSFAKSNVQCAGGTVLEKITLPKTAVYPSSMFFGCATLTEVVIPEDADKFTTIPSSMLRGTSLVASSFQAILNNLDPSAIIMGNALGSITTAIDNLNIPQVAELKDYAFEGSTNIASFTYTGTSLPIVYTSSFPIGYRYHSSWGVGTLTPSKTITLPEGLIPSQENTWLFKDGEIYAPGKEDAIAVANDKKFMTSNDDQIVDPDAGSGDDTTEITIANATAGGLATLLAETTQLADADAFEADGTTAATPVTYAEQPIKITGKMNQADFTALASYAIAEIDLSEVTIDGALAAGGADGTYWFKGLKVTVDNVTATCNPVGGAALTKISLPASAKTLPASMFFGCTTLTDVVLPTSDNFVQIAGQFFYGCNNLANLTWNENINNVQYSAFNNCFVLADLSETIREKLNVVGAGAFSGCKLLTEFTYGTTAKDLQVNTFDNCTSLRSVTIPATVITVSIGAFDFTTGNTCTVETINCGWTEASMPAFKAVPASVAAAQTLFPATFAKGGEKFLTFPSGSNLSAIAATEIFTTAGTTTWGDCFNIKDADGNLPGDEPTTTPDPVQTEATVAVAAEGGLADALAADGSGYTEGTTTKLTVTGAIGDADFATLKTLGVTELDLSGTLATAIPADAFKNNASIETITLPNGLTSVGSSAFLTCKSLVNVNFAEDCKGVTYGTSAFGNCALLSEKSMQAVLDNSGTAVLPIQVLKSNATAVNITIPAKTTSLGTLCFFTCTTIKTITIGYDGNLVNYFPTVAAKGENQTLPADFYASLTGKVPAADEALANDPDSEYIIYVQNGDQQLALQATNLYKRVEVVEGGAPATPVDPDAVVVSINIAQNQSEIESKMTEALEAKGLAYGAHIDKLVITGYPVNVDIAAVLASYDVSEVDMTGVTTLQSTNLANKGFMGNKYLTKVLLPSSSVMKTIGPNAFNGCSNLVDVVFTTDTADASISFTNTNIFTGCTSLSDDSKAAIMAKLANSSTLVF